jgi:leucyl-tRNA synthetase
MTVFEIAVQINGKMRAKIFVTEEMTETEVKKLVLVDAKINKWLEGQEMKKFIYVPGKIVNIVT